MRDFNGYKIGSLAVTGYSHLHTQRCGAKVHYWNVVCDCGKVFKRKATHLSSKVKNQSCGCVVARATGDRFRTHGLKKHPSYNTWRAMISRCQDPKDKNYPNYGGRGIGIEDPRWLLIENFITDMGIAPAKTTLDRIDNSRGYCKENCRWATGSQQARNTRVNRYLEFNGKKQVLTQWAQDLGMTPSAILFRIKMGWSLEEVLTIPSRSIRHSY